jgi:predicted transcriptional regulator
MPKTFITLRLPPDLLAQLDAWRNSQRAPTTRTAVIELAVREFLDRERARKDAAR